MYVSISMTCADACMYVHIYICMYMYIHVAGAFRNGELCRIPNFLQEVVKNGC